jgi:diguanylate cyclase (GGDEF)-like protein/PAS domain S-box-containing protein
MEGSAFDSALLRAAPVGLLVVDAAGIITYASPATEQMTGYDIGDVVGTSILDHLHEVAVEGILGAVGYVTEHPGVLLGPLWAGFHHADGELRVLEILAANRYDDPDLQGLVVSVKDNTTLARLNEALVLHTQEGDLASVLRILSTALLGLPVRGRSAFVDVASGDALISVQLPDALFGPAPPGARPRPWQEALAGGEAVYPETLDGYDEAFRAAAEGAGLVTVWAAPIPAPAASGAGFSSCLVVGRIDPWTVTLNERINVDMVVRHASLVFERDFYLETLNRAATIDPLTGLANRGHLLDPPMRRRAGDDDAASEERLPDAVLYVDLDGFKEVNDDFGHQAGDVALQEVAVRLRQACRRGDELGRVGGDEFVLLLREVDDPEVPIAMAERIIDVVGDPIEVDGPSGRSLVRLGASVGIVRASDHHARTIDELVAAADGALYEAKRSGRNCWRLAGADVD